MYRALLLICACAVFSQAGFAANKFANYESPQVHPLDISPAGGSLAACNTAAGTVEVFSLASGAPALVATIPVGVDPISVRYRSETELWVVNHISDSVSIIDLVLGNVVRTLLTDDEPADVVFAPNGRAFVSCSQANVVQVFNTNDPDAPPVSIRIVGEDPRALAISEDGSEVCVAVFESGNRTTLLAHDFSHDQDGIIPDRVVSRADGPHGGQNPPFNNGSGFEPPLAAGLPAPPPTDLIVRQGGDNIWRDDTGADWSRFVSGADSEASGRVAGWELADNDVALIDTATLDVRYVRDLMNICMAIAVHPGSGEVIVVGTDARNEVRFEPNLQSDFVKVLAAFVDPGMPTSPVVEDLNPHLDYSQIRIPLSERAKSIGDPRAIVWNAAGTRAYITGMGSNNIVVLDGAGDRVGSPISVAEGPTGLVLDEAREQLYVFCRFEAAVLTIDLSSHDLVQTNAIFDPTPSEIKEGRRFLFDTVATSGLGQVSCASCHVDARTDQLAWDLGNPQGTVRDSDDRNLFQIPPPSAADDYHPMKGPRTTQTLQDVIGKEPFHWNGDRDGIEAFRRTYQDLLGDDAPLPPGDMTKLKAYLATIQFGPNPYRNLHNTLDEDVALSHMLAPAPIGQPRNPLTTGDARNGLEIFASEAAGCMECHTLPSGRGTAYTLNVDRFEPIAAGPNGERHLRVAVGANTNVQLSYKVPPLAPVYEKIGLDFLSADASTQGFGILAAGAVDSPLRFAQSLGLPLQDAIDLFAFLLSFGGSDLPLAPDGSTLKPYGPKAHDSHAGVGAQATVRTALDDLARVTMLRTIADSSERVELIAKGKRAGAMRGWWYRGGDAFDGDAPLATASLASLVATSGPGSETTFTLVPGGTGMRLGVDRDLDGVRDFVDASVDSVALDASTTAEGCPTCDETGLLVEVGDTLCLRVDAPAEAFFWTKDGMALVEDGRVQGSACEHLMITELELEDEGLYEVFFEDGAKAGASQQFYVQVVPSTDLPAGSALSLGLLCGVVAGLMGVMGGMGRMEKVTSGRD